MASDLGSALRIACGGLLAAGALAAGAAAGAIAERIVVNRSARDDDGLTEFGRLRGRVVDVTADDGTRLHCEIDDPDAENADSPITVIFAHGYALTLDSWHYQRAALRGRARLVFYDQRSHGRSDRAEFDTHHIDQLGRDLHSVIATVAPTGPLVLIGHSMGGMTLMALADQYPELIRDRVYGAAFIATMAESLSHSNLGLPGLGSVINRIAPHVTASLAKRKGVVEKVRSGGSDLSLLATRLYSFGTVAPAAAGKFVAEMISGTPIDVLSEFLPALQDHHKLEALPVFSRAEVLVIAGDADRLVPRRAVDAIVHQIPGAEYVVIEHGGHMLTLEHYEIVDGLLIDLLDRVKRDLGIPAAV